MQRRRPLLASHRGSSSSPSFPLLSSLFVLSLGLSSAWWWRRQGKGLEGSRVSSGGRLGFYRSSARAWRRGRARTPTALMGRVSGAWTRGGIAASPPRARSHRRGRSRAGRGAGGQGEGKRERGAQPWLGNFGVRARARRGRECACGEFRGRQGDGAGAAGTSRRRLGPSSRRAAKRRRREQAERTGRSERRWRPRDGEEKQGR